MKKTLLLLSILLQNVLSETVENTGFELQTNGSYGYWLNLDYPSSTLRTISASDREQCAIQCGHGCDFSVFEPSSGNCQLKYTDKTAKLQTFFRGQQSGFILGELRCNPLKNEDTGCVIETRRVQGIAECRFYCERFHDCTVMVMAHAPVGVRRPCRLQRLTPTTGKIVTFPLNHLPLNSDENIRGRFDTLGSSGVVGIHANLLSDGKILFSARPEFKRGGPNTEAVARKDKIPFGEIGTVFDPIANTFVPSFIDDNVFCHGALPMENGEIFMTGGDISYEPGSPGEGLAVGLYKQRFFDLKTNTWRYDNDMKASRWYPSLVRTPNGKVLIIGGAKNGTSPEPERSIEIYTPGQNENQFVPSPFLERTGAGWYPQVLMIPGSGNVFVFGNSNWVIVDQHTGKELEQEADLIAGIRSGDYPAGMILLGLRPEDHYRGEILIFGGANDRKQEIGLDTVARLTVTDTGPKPWRYDVGRMPYGRVVSNAILQPNGKVILFNGAQLGRTGGDTGKPNLKASALEPFLYDPYAEDGKRFTVLNASPIQRLYHSTAVILPDARTLIAGTDQATFEPSTSYEHRVEAFTPPWLLNGGERPAIADVTTSKIPYGSTFSVQFTGTVTGASLMTPGSNTHGVDFSQRLVFLQIERNENGELTLLAPPDASIMLQGEHMLFLLNGDTPSVAKFIRLG